MGRIVGLIDKAPDAEELFSCPFCDKKYKSEESLTKHIESKHAERLADAKG